MANNKPMNFLVIWLQGLPSLVLARGVDTHAHLVPYSKGGTTVAILATPIHKIYPPENRGLAEKVKTSGCLITEFCSNAVTKPETSQRNRLISAFAQGLLVVE